MRKNKTCGTESGNVKDVGEFDLIAAVSHEIRTPVSSIKGYADVLRNGDLGKLNSGQRARLKRIIELCDHVTALTNSLLYASQLNLDTQKRKREQFPILSAVDNALKTLRLPLEQKQHSLQVKISKKLPQLWADKGAIEQVFINLINNAIKFTPPKGRINVTAKVEKERYIGVDVSDTGIGIPKAALSKIFTPFYRVSGTEQCGVGLGLSIVKNIINLHRGTILAYSKGGKGSRFHFSIPMDLRSCVRTRSTRYRCKYL